MNAYTTCAEDSCDRSPATGWPLFRVNPKGERGVFMCKEHAAEVHELQREGGSADEQQ